MWPGAKQSRRQAVANDNFYTALSLFLFGAFALDLHFIYPWPATVCNLPLVCILSPICRLNVSHTAREIAINKLFWNLSSDSEGILQARFSVSSAEPRVFLHSPKIKNESVKQTAFKLKIFEDALALAIQQDVMWWPPRPSHVVKPRQWVKFTIKCKLYSKYFKKTEQRWTGNLFTGIKWKICTRWPWNNSMKITSRNFHNFSKILKIAENGSRGAKH